MLSWGSNPVPGLLDGKHRTSNDSSNEMLQLRCKYLCYILNGPLKDLGRAMYETANVLRADKFKIVCDWYFVIEWIQ